MDINNNLRGKSEKSTNCENSPLDPQAAGAENELRVVKDDDTRIGVSASNVATALITPDKIPFVTVWRLILLIHPNVMRVYDFMNDVGLAVEYFENDKTAYCCFTLAFTTLQAITTAWISCMIHQPRSVEADDKEEDEREESWWDKAAKLIARYGIIIPLLLAMPLCNLRNLYYAWKVRKYQLKGDEAGLLPYHRMMLVEDRDLTLLGVVACCLQAAPQLILQLYILLTEYNQPMNYLMCFKIVGGIMTFISLGSAMKDYYCAIREAQPDGARVSDVGRVLLVLWHFGVIAARVFTIAISASNWTLHTLLACTVNWTIWTVWIYAKGNSASLVLLGKKATGSSGSASETLGQKIRNLLFSGVMAVVYTFTLVNLKEGRSIVRNSVYYVLCVLQNGTVFVLYFILTNAAMEEVLLSEYLLIFSVALFLVGIVAMATYYKFFHPATVQSPIDFKWKRKT